MLYCRYYYNQFVMVIFIMHKYFTTNFTIMRRTRELFMTGLQIELHKIFFCTPKPRGRNVLQRV
jgi:hypothetical protein